MPVVSSTIVSNQVQVNGTKLIHEQHTYSDGVIYSHIYSAEGDTTDAFLEEVCTLRGQNIGKILDDKQLAIEQAANFEIPLTPLEIMRRLTPTEWENFQNSTDATIKYFRGVFEKTPLIYRTDPLTIAGFAALENVGILTSQRISEILL